MEKVVCVCVCVCVCVREDVEWTNLVVSIVMSMDLVKKAMNFLVQ